MAPIGAGDPARGVIVGPMARLPKLDEGLGERLRRAAIDEGRPKASRDLLDRPLPKAMAGRKWDASVASPRATRFLAIGAGNEIECVWSEPGRGTG